MNRLTRAITPALVAAAVIAAVALGPRFTKSTPAQGVPDAVITPTPPHLDVEFASVDDQPPPPGLLGYRAGDVLSYGLHQNRRVILECAADSAGPMAGQEAQAASLDFEDSGRLEVRIYEVTDHEMLMGFTLSEVRIAASSETDLESLTTLAESLRNEVLAIVSSRGRVERLLLPDLLFPEVGNYWRDLLSRWQIVYPDDPAQLEWMTEEDDTTGRCLACIFRVHGVRTGVLPHLAWCRNANMDPRWPHRNEG